MPVAGASVVAALWFPPNERLVATSVGTNAVYAGNIFTNLFALIFITNENETVNNVVELEAGTNTTISPDLAFSLLNRDEIMHVMYVEFCLAAFAFVLVFVYFPSKPPTPPDSTAIVERLNFRKGMKTLFTIKSFLALLVIYTCVQGIGVAIDSLTNIIGASASFPEDKINILSFSLAILCVICVPLTIILIERLCGHLQYVMAIAYGLIALSHLWLVLLLFKIAPRKFYGFAIPFSLQALVRQLAQPVLVQVACDITFPVQEGVTGGILDWASSSIGIVILLLLKIPSIGITWLPIVYMAVVVVSAVWISLLKIEYKRSEVKTEESETNTQ